MYTAMKAFCDPFSAFCIDYDDAFIQTSTSCEWMSNKSDATAGCDTGRVKKRQRHFVTGAD